MIEPVIVTVILKPASEQTGSKTMANSFAKLESWASTNDVTVQPPIDTDPEALKFATVLASDNSEADDLIGEILSLPFVDTCYKKPTDALP